LIALILLSSLITILHSNSTNIITLPQFTMTRQSTTFSVRFSTLSLSEDAKKTIE